MKKWGFKLLNNLPDMTSMELEPAAQKQLSLFSAWPIPKTPPGYSLPDPGTLMLGTDPAGVQNMSGVCSLTDLYAPGHTTCGL